MGDNEPKSQSLSLQVWETAGGQGSCQHLARKDPRSQVGSRAGEVFNPAGQRLWRRMDAKGDHHSMGQQSGVWSWAVSAMVWSLLSYTLKVVHLTLWLSCKCFGTLGGKWGIPPGASL